MKLFSIVRDTDGYGYATELHIGPLKLSSDSAMVQLPIHQTLGIHIDHWWSNEVKAFGAPERIYLNLAYLGFIMIGLPTNHKIDIDLDAHQVVDMHAKTRWHWARAQRWSPFKGYELRKWSVFVYGPPKMILCRAQSPPHLNRFGRENHWTCGAVRWHPGLHTWEVQDNPMYAIRDWRTQ